MEVKWLNFAMFLVSVGVANAMWNNLNCPAPRSPDNGLSFIFRNGELVHFRCHPGYLMQGKPVAYCVNSVWTEPSPECISIRTWNRPSEVEAQGASTSYYHSRPQGLGQPNLTRDGRLDKQRQLFNWGDGSSSHHKQSVYGDGPRRLPLINGIWPPQNHAEQVMSLGPQSTPGPKMLVKEEIAIAELRHRQLEELKKQRHAIVGNYDANSRKKGHKKRRKNSVLVDESAPRETVISLGNTEDGDALSVALAKPANLTTTESWGHKYRHRDGRKRKRHGKGKKHHQTHPNYDNGFIIARSSRVDSSGIAPYQQGLFFNRQPLVDTTKQQKVSEFRRKPVERVRHHHNRSMEQYDASCTETLFGREVPMIAPQVSNAFVYRYETRKNKEFPFNAYMQVMYRCLSGYTFSNADVRTLNCRQSAWVGEVPRCVKA